MNHHKDKFISPTIYKELTGLEVKKNGKVEHSDLTHDDQIFSYLMAMYVWYEGKDLRENFGIQKFGIKTEEAVDDVVDMETTTTGSDISKELAYVSRDEQDKLELQINEMQANKGMLFSEFVAKQRAKEDQQLKMMMQNPVFKEAYARKYGISPDNVSIDQTQDAGSGLNKLPDSLFTDFIKDESELGNNSIYANLNNYSINPDNYVIEDESKQ